MSMWQEAFRAKFKDVLKSERESAPGEPEFTIAPDAVIDALSFLKSAEGGEFNHLADLTSYDEAVSGCRFHVVYELISMARKQRCSVIAQISDQNSPSVPSIVSLWSGANWLEREVYDLMGISFEGHPDMRRILLPPSFKGHPLKKDFLVDYRQTFEGGDLEKNLFDPFGTSVVRGD